MLAPDPQIEVLKNQLRAALAALGEAHAPTSPGPMHETVSEAGDYIRAHPGCGGKDVAAAIDRSFEHFRRTIVPKLKAAGYFNRRGVGYFPPLKSL